MIILYQLEKIIIYQLEKNKINQKKICEIKFLPDFLLKKRSKIPFRNRQTQKGEFINWKNI